METKASFGFKSKLVTGIAIGLMVVVMVLEWTVLVGDQVAKLNVGLQPEQTGTIQVERVGETHLVEIDTRRLSRRESKGVRISMRLEDPSGAAIYENNELASRKERFFSFTPKAAGPYKLYLERKMLIGSASGVADVRVLVNDRRILSRIMAALPF